MFQESISKALFDILAVILVLLAIVARLSSLGTTISIERDWVVEIAKANEFLLAGKVQSLSKLEFRLEKIVYFSIQYGPRNIDKKAYLFVL